MAGKRISFEGLVGLYAIVKYEDDAELGTTDVLTTAFITCKPGTV